jgi:hypothetical protein
MNVQPYFVSFAVKDRINNTMHDVQQDRLGRASKDPVRTAKSGLLAALKSSRLVNLGRSGSRDAQRKNVYSSKPQEQCC